MCYYLCHFLNLLWHNIHAEKYTHVLSVSYCLHGWCFATGDFMLDGNFCVGHRSCMGPGASFMAPHWHHLPKGGLRPSLSPVFLDSQDQCSETGTSPVARKESNHVHSCTQVHGHFSTRSCSFRDKRTQGLDTYHRSSRNSWDLGSVVLIIFNKKTCFQVNKSLTCSTNVSSALVRHGGRQKGRPGVAAAHSALMELPPAAKSNRSIRKRVSNINT